MKKIFTIKQPTEEGYRVYESNPKDCEGCPFLSNVQIKET